MSKITRAVVIAAMDRFIRLAVIAVIGLSGLSYSAAVLAQSGLDTGRDAKGYGILEPLWHSATAAWVFGGTILMVLSAMALWRYRSIVGLNRDLLKIIAEREEAENALRESEQRYRTVLDASPEMIYLHCDGKLAFANPPALKLLRAKSLDQIAGIDPIEFVHPEDCDLIRSRRARTRETGKSQGLNEVRYILADGGIAHVETTSAYVEWNGQPAHLVMGRDVTERKRAEQSLTEQEERIRAIMQNIADGVVTFDENGTVESANAAAEQMFGYAAEDMIGRNVKLLITGTVRDGRDNDSQSYLFTGMGSLLGTGPHEVVGCRRDGSSFLISLAVSEMRAGGKRSFVGAMRDITEQKQRDQELRQAQKMEAVGQLTGGIAHDFNNLLSIILGNAEILKDIHGEDDMIDATIRAATRGGELAHQLLAFSRRQNLMPKVIDLGSVVAGMTDMLQRTLGETISIETRTATDLWCVEVDEGQLENALLNLAINARDAMPDGGSLIIETTNFTLDDDETATGVSAAAGDFTMLAVTDSGTGMSPEILEHAFEPFFTTKEAGEGSGLGLSMVYGFAKQSGGRVTIDSEVGRGTTMKLILPRAREPALPAGKNLGAEDPLGNGENVLLVEDEADVLAYTATLLGRLGYSVSEANDGDSAMAVLESADRIDALLTDVVLPGAMSGPEIADEAQRQHPGMSVLFMSGYSDQVLSRHGPLGNGVEVLNKPFRRNELAQKLRNALDGSRIGA